MDCPRMLYDTMRYQDPVLYFTCILKYSSHHQVGIHRKLLTSKINILICKRYLLKNNINHS